MMHYQIKLQKNGAGPLYNFGWPKEYGDQLRVLQTHKHHTATNIKQHGNCPFQNDRIIMVPA